MVESSMPAEAAVAAALMQKLCPVCRCAGTLAASSARRTCLTNFCFDRDVWLSQWKRGPGTLPQ